MKPRSLPLRLVLVLSCLSLLAGCLNLSQTRVTPEHRQLKNKVAVVVLMDPAPRVHHMQLSVLESTASQLEFPGWNVRAVVSDYLAQRMRGMSLEVKTVQYDDSTFPTPYDSSMAYPAFERMRQPLGAWAAGQGLDMVVVVYRQVSEDFFGESIENLIGYGVARHAAERTDAYATVYLEALDTSGRLIGNSDGQKNIPIDDALWRPEFSVDKQRLAVSGATGKVLREQVTQALQDAVLLAAQEAGLSH